MRLLFLGRPGAGNKYIKVVGRHTAYIVAGLGASFTKVLAETYIVCKSLLLQTQWHARVTARSS